MMTTFHFCEIKHVVCVQISPGCITLPIDPCQENLKLVHSHVKKCPRSEVCYLNQAYSKEVKKHGKRH